MNENAATQAPKPEETDHLKLILEELKKQNQTIEHLTHHLLTHVNNGRSAYGLPLLPTKCEPN